MSKFQRNKTLQIYLDIFKLRFYHSFLTETLIFFLIRHSNVSIQVFLKYLIIEIFVNPIEPSTLLIYVGHHACPRF